MKIHIELDTSNSTISDDYKKLLDLASGLNGLARPAERAPLGCSDVSETKIQGLSDRWSTARTSGHETMAVNRVRGSTATNGETSDVVHGSTLAEAQSESGRGYATNGTLQVVTEVSQEEVEASYTDLAVEQPGEHVNIAAEIEEAAKDAEPSYAELLELVNPPPSFEDLTTKYATQAPVHLEVEPEKPKRTRRTSAQKAQDELGVQEIRAAERAAMEEAIRNLAPRAPAAAQAVPMPPPVAQQWAPEPVVQATPALALPGSLPMPPMRPAPVPTPPPIPTPAPVAAPALVLPGSLPPPVHAVSAASTVPTPPPIALQTPASSGQAMVLPNIPPNGHPMPLPDLMTVVRLSSTVRSGIAFGVLSKHNLFSPETIPEDMRAQIAREIAIDANFIAA